MLVRKFHRHSSQNGAPPSRGVWHCGQISASGAPAGPGGRGPRVAVGGRRRGRRGHGGGHAVTADLAPVVGTRLVSVRAGRHGRRFPLSFSGTSAGQSDVPVVLQRAPSESAPHSCVARPVEWSTMTYLMLCSDITTGPLPRTSVARQLGRNFGACGFCGCGPRLSDVRTRGRGSAVCGSPWGLSAGSARGSVGCPGPRGGDCRLLHADRLGRPCFQRHLVGVRDLRLQSHSTRRDVDDVHHLRKQFRGVLVPQAPASCTARPSLAVAPSSSPALRASRPSWMAWASSAWPV